MVRFQRLTLRAMDTHLRADFGRSLDDYDVLHQLVDAGEPLRMGELAERLVVANSSCHRIVGRLVDDQLLARWAGEIDRREVLVSLTGEGRRVHRRMALTHTRDIDALFTGTLSDTEIEALGSAFDRLLNRYSGSGT